MEPEQQSPTLPSLAPPEEKNESWGDLFRFAIITAFIVIPIRFFIAQPFIVSGTSMDPTFRNGQYLIVDEISYRFEAPKRGEVIIFKMPTEKKYLIKRIVGLPGETVELNHKSVTIKNEANPKGFALDESYLTFTRDELNQTFTMGPNQYFVMGDNRPVSYDSRSWGPLDASNIIGRPIVSLYPFQTIAFFPGSRSVQEKQ